MDSERRANQAGRRSAAFAGAKLSRVLWFQLHDAGRAMIAMLPDCWAAAHPKQVLVHRNEEARQVANRKGDDRQKRGESV